MPCLIPDAKRTAVERALTAAFGTTTMDAATPITGGLSGALIYRIRVGGIAYVLRIEGTGDAFRDPVRGYACMRTAAAGFLAPRVRYADAADGVAILDFVPQQSLAMDYPGSRRDLITEVAQGVRALHGGPAFPPLMDYLDAVGLLIGQFRAAGRWNSPAAEELFGRYADLRAAYRTAPADRVASHNDLNPGNLLYDGARIWLIDWESAFLADRYVDLSCVANWFTVGPEEEEALLRVYFGAPPDVMQRARLFLMRQVNHLFYGIMFLGGAAAERPQPQDLEDDIPAPDLAQLHAGLPTGAFSLEAWADRVTYGKSRLAAALANMQSAAFAQAVETLAAA